MTTTLAPAPAPAVLTIPEAPARARRNPFAQRGFTTLLATEARIWLRQPSALFWALVFPTAIIALNGFMSYDFSRTPVEMPGHLFDGLTGLQIMLPALLLMAPSIALISFIPSDIGGSRERGVLKRFSASPMNPRALLATQLVINTAASIVGAALALTVTAVLFGVTVPNNLAVVVLSFVLGCAAMGAVGILCAARVSKYQVGSIVGQAVMFGLLILSGAIGGLAQQNEVLATVARFSPLGAVTQAMEIGWHGTGFPLVEVLTAIAWTVVATAVGLKIFRWR